ncbi:MAG: MATE family efflux transporter [Nitriliruptorales bacterium]|nr:MATE family efflux transporter [Nitriliruptorales bacterium]
MRPRWSPRRSRWSRSVDREILRLALPATAALAADPLLSLVDTALVGRLGPVPLAALGIDTAVFTTVFFGFNFLTYGTTASVAHRRGAGDPEGAATYAVQALWLAVGLGVAVTAVLLVAAPWIVRAMGAAPDVVAPAMLYLRIRATAATAVLVVQVGHGAFRGLKDTRTPLVVTVAANIVNGVISWVMIYGVGMGIAGAALGTVVAEVGGAAAFLWLGARRFRLLSMRVDREAMTAIIRVSRDLFLRTASLLSGLLVTTAVAARMGTVVVAGHQVARELWTMLALVLDGFAIAGQAMIATALGAGDSVLARAQSNRLVGWALAGGALLGVIYLPLGSVLPGIFTTDVAVLGAVSSVWVIVALLQPVGGVVFVLDGVLMGAGDFTFLFGSTALASLAILVPIGLAALALGWGLEGVWLGMAAMMLVRLMATVWRWRSGRWAAA